jgi:hypothetical protein
MNDAFHIKQAYLYIQPSMYLLFTSFITFDNNLEL